MQSTKPNIFRYQFFAAKNSFTILLLCFAGFISSCAREQSASEKRREEQDRQYQRLIKAEGFYQGFVKISPDVQLPLSLQLTPGRNPTDGNEDPRITATMRVGLFGGVKTSTQMTSFDFKDGKFTASFPKSSGGKQGSSGASVEIQGIISENKIQSARLITPLSGEFEVELNKNNASLFGDLEEFQFSLNIAVANKDPAKAVLKIKRLKEDVAAPENADLGTMPSFSASLFFDGLAAFPEKAKSVVYNPFKGSLSFYFGDRTEILFQNFFEESSDTAKSKLRSALFFGGQEVAQISLIPANEAQKIVLGSMPPILFKGTYQGVARDAPKYTTLGFFEHLGGTKENPVDLEFSHIPEMRLRLSLCDGEQPGFMKREFHLSKLDMLRREAFLKPKNEMEKNEELIVSFTSDWKNINGVISNSNSNDNPSTAKVKVQLQAVEGENASCL